MRSWGDLVNTFRTLSQPALVASSAADKLLVTAPVNPAHACLTISLGDCLKNATTCAQCFHIASTATITAATAAATAIGTKPMAASTPAKPAATAPSAPA